MKDYIDRKEARREIIARRDKQAATKAYGWEWEYNGFNHSVLAIGCIPAADVVEVVRCKDCRWWNGKEARVCVIEPYEPCRKPDDYCSRGERKGGDE